MQRLARVIPHVVVALLAAGLLVPGVVAPHEASAKNIVDVNNRTKVITITVQADLVGGDEGYAEYLQQSFSEHWGQEFEYRCYTVKISLDIAVIAEGELPANNAPRHRIVVNQIDPGDSFVAAYTRPEPYRPADHSGQIELSNFNFPSVIAHEFGHVLGLPDEYTYVDADGNGRRSAGERSVLDTSFPDVEWSLMGDDRSGGVLQRHIDTIAGKHAPRGSIECKWQGSLDYRTVGSDPTGQNAHTALMAFTMDEDDAGVLDGTGSATITYEGSGTTECGAWTSRIEPVTVDIAVTGQRTDDTMTLSIVPWGDTQTTGTDTTCGGDTYTFAHDAWLFVSIPDWIPPLSQQGNTFSFDDHVTNATGETWLVIIVEPLDDEGVPVG